MEFEWDEDKRLGNIEKHRVDFLEAALIFEGWVFELIDARHDYGETRYLSIGMVDGDCYVVVTTRRPGSIRLISAWKGGRRDRAKYEEGLARRAAGDEGAR